MKAYDYSLLIKRISERDPEVLAVKLGISPDRLINLLSGRAEFRADEIIRCANLLGLDSNEIRTYFFTEKTRN